MKNPNRKFILFWERTRRINKWRFIFPVGLFIGLALFGFWQLFRFGDQDFFYFFVEFSASLFLGIFILARLVWLYNEKKFVRVLRRIQTPLFN
jgi:hypothetical protein